MFIRVIRKSMGTGLAVGLAAVNVLAGGLATGLRTSTGGIRGLPVVHVRTSAFCSNGTSGRCLVSTALWRQACDVSTGENINTKHTGYGSYHRNGDMDGTIRGGAQTEMVWLNRRYMGDCQSGARKAGVHAPSLATQMGLWNSIGRWMHIQGSTPNFQEGGNQV